MKSEEGDIKCFDYFLRTGKKLIHAYIASSIFCVLCVYVEVAYTFAVSLKQVIIESGIVIYRQSSVLFFYKVLIACLKGAPDPMN